MAILNFPNTGLYVGLTYTGDNGVTYVYDGVKWVGEALVTQGTTGFTGSRGNLGYTGSRGVGYTGSQGDRGYVGSEGSPGQQGNRGYTGSKGDPGDRGLQGNTGEQGISVTLVGSTSTSAGLPGVGNPGDGWIVTDTGNLWFWNTVASAWNDIGQIVGPQGDLGYTGSKGSTGDIGLTGNLGYTGSQGVHGYDGSRGDTGYTGSQGDPGYVGSQGDVGYVGSTGDTGPQGYSGSVGYTGSQGDLGYSGSIGYTGSKGDQGEPGGNANTGNFVFTDDQMSVTDNGDITVVTNNNTWTFSNTGTLTLPGGNSKLYTSGPSGENVDITAGPGGWAELASSNGNSYVWVDDNGAYVATYATTSFKQWTFSTSGSLISPGHIIPGADLEYDLGSTSSQWRSIYVGTGTIYIGGVALGVNQDNYVTVDGNPVITVNTAGNITIQGDNILTPVAVSDTAPDAGVTDGNLWYNSLDGRTYVSYSGQWIDTSPAVVPNPETYLGNIAIDGDTLNINGGTLTIDDTGTLLVNGSEVSGSGYGATLTASDTDPETSTGTLWFNTIEGRTYLKYNNQWVDVNPTVVPPPETYLGSITIDGSTINMNGGTLAISNTGTLLVNGQPVTGSNDTGLITFDGVKIIGDGDDGQAGSIKLVPNNANYGSGQWVNIYPTGAFDYPHVHMAAGSGGELYIGNDQQYVKTGINGNIDISSFDGTNTNVWSFGTDGSTTFPNDTILGTGQDPNVYIETSTTATTSTWSFGTDGVLTLPAATPVIKGGGTGTDVTVVATTGSNTATWTFGANGSIVFPDATVQTTAYTGGGGSLSGNPFIATIDEFTTTQGVYLGIGDITPRIIFANGSEPNWQIDSDGYGVMRIFQPNNVAVSINTSTFTIETNSLLVHNNINIDGEDIGLVVDASGLNRFGFMKYSGIEGALVHSTAPGAAVPLRFGRVSLANITSATSYDFITEIYVGTNGYVRIADDGSNTISDPTERLEVDGNIQATGKLIGNTATIGVGGLTVDGPVTFNSSFSFLGTATVISSNSGTFFGDTYGVGALYAGVAGYSPLPSTVIQSSANVNAYIQNNFQNINNGNQASTEWVATANNGDDSNHYLDMGIAGGGWDGSQTNSVGSAAGANDSWIYAQGSTSTSAGGNLILGTIKNGKSVKILTGSTGSSSIVATFNGRNTNATTTNSGSLQVVGGVGISQNLYAGTVYSNDGYFRGPTGYGSIQLASGGAAYMDSIVLNGTGLIKGPAGYLNITLNSGGAGAVRFASTATVASTTSATSTTTGALIVNGGAGIAGNAYVGGYVVQQVLPAFRVYGNGGAVSTGTTMTNSHYVVDFNQGNYLNTSTGVFTAPVAGIYQVNLVARTNSNSSPNPSQVIVYKNNTITAIMVEWAANTTVNHIGGSTAIKLAAGDTLKTVITLGTISFDGNDNWSVAFLG